MLKGTILQAISINIMDRKINGNLPFIFIEKR